MSDLQMANVSTPCRTGRLEHLDALRGVAAIVVVFQHAIETSLRILGDAGLLGQVLHMLTFEAFNLGKFGVVVFFAISGFVIPFSFKGDRPVLRFAISRGFRLYPTYWLSLAIAIPVGLAAGVAYTVPQVVANTTMIQVLFGQADVLGVYWTLFIEMLFYGICVLTFLIGRLRSPGYMLLVLAGFLGVSLAAGTVNFLLERELPIALPVSLAVMHFGALARQLLVEREPSARRWFTVGAALMFVLLIPICILGYGRDIAHGGFIPYLTSYWVALVVFLACVFGRLFVSSTTLFLGRISYALYLFHAIAILAALPLGRAVPLMWAAPVVILVTACAIPVSWVVFLWIERPAIALGHRIANRVSGVPKG